MATWAPVSSSQARAIASASSRATPGPSTALSSSASARPLKVTLRSRSSPNSARHARFEPATFGSGEGNERSAGDSKGLQVVENPRLPNRDRVQTLQRVAGCSTPLVTSLLQGSDAKGRRLQTVKEVAVMLRVSTATVYAMVKRGEFEHVRVSNSIRIVWAPEVH